MFENVGGKLKFLSKILMISFSILGVIIGIKILSINETVLGIFGIEKGENPLFVVGLLTIIISPIVSYISCLAMYGIGEIIDKMDVIKEHNNILGNKDTKSDYSDKAASSVVSHSEHAPVVTLDNHNECFCPGCKRSLTFETSFGIKQCVHCKKYFKVVKK